MAARRSICGRAKWDACSFAGSKTRRDDMVQVDIFWSYALGAGFAIANAHQLEQERKAGRSAFDLRSFRDTILFLSCIFVPSGAYLVWAFPSWETMHVGDKNMP